MKNKNSEYKVGDRVEIFEDPITKTKSEGLAEIKFIWNETDEIIRASVEFDSDLAEGTFMRTIAK